MIARCARCQGTFTTDRFGVQTCPHCGSEILLADPSGAAAPAAPPAQAAPPPPPPAAGEPAWGAPPAPPPPPQAAPPPPPAAPPPPPAGWADPSRGFGAPPGYGPPPGGFGGPPGWPPPPGAGMSSPGELPSPFAQRAGRFLPAFFETFKLVATRPTEFFRRVRVDQSGTAVLFGVVAASVGTMVSAIYSAISMQASMAAMERMAKGMPEEQARFLLEFSQAMGGKLQLLEALAAPLFWFIMIYLGAALLHAVLAVLKATPRGFDATLTVVGYAAGLYLFLALPVCGSLVALVWALVVLIIGLGEAQRCGPGKAAAAVFAPVILGCLCCCAAIGSIGASGAGLLEQLKQAAEAAKDQGTNL